MDLYYVPGKVEKCTLIHGEVWLPCSILSTDPCRVTPVLPQIMWSPLCRRPYPRMNNDCRQNNGSTRSRLTGALDSCRFVPTDGRTDHLVGERVVVMYHAPKSFLYQNWDESIVIPFPKSLKTLWTACCLSSGSSSPLCFYANEGWWVRQNTTVVWSWFIGSTMTTCFGRAWPSSGHKLLYN